MARTHWLGPTGQLLDLQGDMDRLVPLAEDVSIERAAAVCAAMYRMAAMRTLVTNANDGANAVVACVKAAVQDLTAGKGYQAAHLLPGTITVAGRPVWAVAPPNATGAARRLAIQLEGSFAETAVLPACVNRADSAGEADGKRPASVDPDEAHDLLAGLKARFGHRVQELWRDPRAVTGTPLFVNRTLVHDVLARWFQELSHVYQAAAWRKRQAADRAGVGSDTRTRRRAEARVLETYATRFVVANVGRFVEVHAQAVAREYDGRGA